jgi:amidohydrolase
MKSMQNEVRRRAAELAPETIAIRRHLHKHPELSFHERETSAYIAGMLERFDIPFRRMPGPDGSGYGLVADIEGGGGGHSIALRADMDALPITEENDVEFRSTNDGVMHACGHDAHSAIVLTAGRILHEMRDHFNGRVRLIFQPAEERSPGGAKGMIEQGVLSGVNRILGEHINPSLSAGTVGFRPGLMMASADEIYLTVSGRGGHAAAPSALVDPVLITSHIIVALQQVVSRRANPELPSVLSFGRVIADGAMNVIPDRVTVAGTFRTVNEEWRERALETITHIAQSLAEGMDGSCEVEIIRGYPVLENDDELTARTRQAAEAYLGPQNVVDLPLVMWAEDFSYYNREIPGCFYNLGVANEQEGWTRPLHNSRLMIDEKALETGSGLMAWLALSELNPDGDLQASEK